MTIKISFLNNNFPVMFSVTFIEKSNIEVEETTNVGRQAWEYDAAIWHTFQWFVAQIQLN